ncbi:hypothetical protein GCM10022225_09160 [Plantactinospora mayteni]|uniref:PBP domain-containing protein n=1 Tax=Plantactinospora mayteni TaxID=566021 RepID=A0ABQ4EJG1_9ACTN|nr:hypothetical protein [Plantactinospora mayteni]GIG94337.1 hypothetical protein Pma05_09100 [Plantactinospora mayteni]
MRRRPGSPSLRRRWAAAVAAALVAPTALLAVGGLDTSQPALAAVPGDRLTESAMTQNGRRGQFEDFSNLTVTVSQTRNLVTQGIEIAWTGGKPTAPGSEYGTNYLQIMQCWGPDPNAPDFRETCQFGGLTAKGEVSEEQELQVGVSASSRSVQFNLDATGNPAGRDPAERLPNDAEFIPFKSSDGLRTRMKDFPPQGAPDDGVPDTEDFFRRDETNEVVATRTASDGVGRTIFEVQRGSDAKGLNCGEVVAGFPAGRRCWLVVVPRGERDFYGNLNQSPRRISGSPLLPSYFANRIVFPLEFEPIQPPCPLGGEVFDTVGSELVAPAAVSWQASLCAGGQAAFSHTVTTEVTTDAAVRLPGAQGRGVGYVDVPVVREETDPMIMHAPITVNGAVIAFQIEARTSKSEIPGSTEEAQRMNGQPLPELKLTPRLVAKLLTQSYQLEVPDPSANPDIAKNPRSIRVDDEFTELNPIFKSFFPTSRHYPIQVPDGESVLARRVWQWVLADEAARKWLSGLPDEQGMRVNPAYVPLVFGDGQGMSRFPKEDPSCRMGEPTTGVPKFEYCMPGFAPWAESLEVAARQTLRSDARQRIVWDETAGGIDPANPQARLGDYKAAPPPLPGRKFGLGITDAASAARYGLATASLCDAEGGNCVKADTAGLLGGVGAMEPSLVEGVLQPNPTRSVSGAYPLTMLTYAAANLERAEPARREYARLLRYIATDGQTIGSKPGQLPPGYAALPKALRDQTLAVAAELAKATPSSPGTADPDTSAPDPTPSSSLATPTPGAIPSAAAIPSPAPTASAPPVPVAATTPTPGEPVGWMRFLLLAILGVGVASGISGPTMLMIGYRRPASDGTKT